jgi:hypothetical protein
MHSDDTRAVLEQELRQVETDLAELRDTANRLRREVGDGPMDLVDRSALLSEAEEQDAVAEDLEARRAELRHKLGLE